MDRRFPLKADWIVFVTLFCLPLSSFSANQSDAKLLAFDDLVEMDLEQLLSISVASKREESIDVAPGIVSVVTAQDIQRFGYRNLRDLLNRQTHLQIVGSNLFPHNKVTMRGVNNSHIDSNVLLQINGRPIRETTLSSINHDLYNFFPVEAIEKIEIIRGPGSVLYGTNAFSGVINIVTHKGTEQAMAEVNGTLGSFDSAKLQASAGGMVSDLKMFAAMNVVDTEGGEFSDVSDQFGNRDDYPIGYSGAQGILRMDYGGFSLNGLYSKTTTDNVRSVFAYPATEHEFDRVYVDAGYRYEVDYNWDIVSNITYHQSDSILTILPGQSSPNSTGEAKTYLAEVVSRSNFLGRLNLLVGGSYEKSTAKGDTEFETIAKSFYVQADYQWMSNLKLIAGAQYNDPDEADSDVAPRLGAIYNIDPYWGVKLLYSSAFRDASPLERFIDVPTVRGDSGLQPETIDTYDLQLFYYRGANSFAFTLFHSQQENIITRQPGTPVQIINGGSIDYHGAEVEGRLQPHRQWLLLANASYQKNKSNAGEKDVSYAPDLMVKLGAHYEFSRAMQVGAYASYFAESTLQNDSAGFYNPDADSYTLVTLNLESNLGALFESENLQPFSLGLYVDNLLDEEIYFPSISRTEVNSLPHHPGRGFYLTLTGAL